MIRKFLSKSGKIRFEEDRIDNIPVIRIRVDEDFWMNEISFIEWVLIELLDSLSGFYGYRITIK